VVFGKVKEEFQETALLRKKVGAPSANEGPVLQIAGHVFVKAGLTLNKVECVYFKVRHPQQKADLDEQQHPLTGHAVAFSFQSSPREALPSPIP
jgi:hypothetical protein